MAGEMNTGVPPQVAVQSQDELRKQRLDIKNLLPLDIYEGMVYASYIASALPYGDQIQNRHIRGFYQTFWHIYHYVKNSVEADKINPELVGDIDMWFRLMRGQHRNTKLILVGVDLYLIFVKNLQKWGIGRLFEKSIDPPFMIEDMDDFDLLIEEVDEEVVTLGVSVE
jgi:hypothetical protein